MTATISEPQGGTHSAGAKRGFWNRQLPHYPANGPRSAYLAITVIATVVLYYELYIQSAVATQIISDFGFTFAQFVLILVVGNAVGAFASLGAGLADRWGRANLVVIGLIITGALIAFVLPHAGNKLTYGAAFALLSLVEGVVLVATPALIRDFSPQIGRGSAMGFWTLGPVLGSLVVTEVSSNTLASHPNWRFQFYLCGGIGLGVAVIALFGLRELAPALRDQLMVSMRDKALIEARAANLDTEQVLEGHWRQMLRGDIIGSAFAVAVYLLLYYMLVAFAVIYFVTVYGYSESRANSLLNWFWISNALALVVAGVASDALRVRKPFMILGAAISLVGAALFASAATDPSVSYYTIAGYFVLTAAGQGLAYVAWMAAFTETVEKHNPAATATGLAVWGWILRAIVTAGFAVLIIALPATGTLVDKGQRVQAIAAKYPQQIATLSKIDPITQSLLQNPADTVAQGQAVAEIAGKGVTLLDVATLQDLQTKHAAEIQTLQAIDPVTALALLNGKTDPATVGKAITDVATKFNISSAEATQRLIAVNAIPRPNLVLLATKGQIVQAAVAELKKVAAIPPADSKYLAKNASAVQRAQKDNPHQWQRWWWVCFAGQVVFVPFIFLLSGRWSPKAARADEREHERLTAQALQDISAHRGPGASNAPSYDPPPTSSPYGPPPGGEG